MKKRISTVTLSGAWMVLALLCLSLTAQAQSTTIVGYLSNFDAVNNTGQDVHGLEIELEGLQPSDIYYTFSANRYGAPTVVQSPTGVFLRWQSPVDPATQLFTQTTIPHPANTPFGGTCYQWYAATYPTSGCEHFGVTLRANPTATTYRWLVADPSNAGVLAAYGTALAIPGPVWVIAPPPPQQPAAPPVVEVQIEAPRPPNPELQFGDAQWVKVFKTELPREVGLDELVADNAVVPQAPAQAEITWKLLQHNPHSANSGVLRNSGGINGGSRSVVRRFEFYTYTGVYDPLDHGAVCGGDGLCNSPQPGELGDLIGAQMAAANLAVPSLSVVPSGNGTVSSADKKISCGSKCSAFYNVGDIVTLSAKPGSNSVFTGWGGACSGSLLNCSVAVTDALNVTATFAVPPATGGGGGGTTGAPILSVKTAGGKGAVTSTPAGIDCGRTCTATVTAGSAFTLTATPDAGFRFVNWSGACTGTSLTCQVTVNSSATVQANFIK